MAARDKYLEDLCSRQKDGRYIGEVYDLQVFTPDSCVFVLAVIGLKILWTEPLNLGQLP